MPWASLWSVLATRAEKRRANMARLHQHGLEALALHAADEPFRQRPRFESEPNKSSRKGASRFANASGSLAT